MLKSIADGHPKIMDALPNSGADVFTFAQNYVEDLHFEQCLFGSGRADLAKIDDGIGFRAFLYKAWIKSRPELSPDDEKILLSAQSVKQLRGLVGHPGNRKRVEGEKSIQVFERFHPLADLALLNILSNRLDTLERPDGFPYLLCHINVAKIIRSARAKHRGSSSGQKKSTAVIDVQGLGLQLREKVLEKKEFPELEERKQACLKPRDGEVVVPLKPHPIPQPSAEDVAALFRELGDPAKY